LIPDDSGEVGKGAQVTNIKAALRMRPKTSRPHHFSANGHA
jgi:hypothetical protein